jgi:hypothetical protein
MVNKVSSFCRRTPDKKYIMTPGDTEGDWKMFLVICYYSFELKNSNPIFEN